MCLLVRVACGGLTRVGTQVREENLAWVGTGQGTSKVVQVPS